MKKLIFILFVALSITSCKKKDYVSFELKIDNLEKGDSVTYINSRGYRKVLHLDKEGLFKDTLKIPEAGLFGVVIGNVGQLQTFLRNGYDIKVTADAKDLMKTAKFTGKGSDNSNYLASRMVEVLAFNDQLNGLYQKDSVTFFKEINTFEEKMTKLLSNVKKADTTLVRIEKDGLKGYVQDLKSSYQIRHDMMMKFAKGNPSPKFTNYEDIKGGKKSLDDFKGKFVYIDVWATWCKPCVAEIPALKTLAKEYAGKNIEFVSISSDQPTDYEKWKAMVNEKQMDWVQLFAGSDYMFMQEYQISSIPRFIFIDDKGNIVNADAPRPTDTETVKKMFADAGVK